MENYAISEFLLKYVILPLLTGLATLGFWAFKMVKNDLDDTKKRTDQLEKELVQVRQVAETEFKYISRDIKEQKDDIKEIKNLILRLIGEE